jgi:hypothetical protein
MKLPALVKSSGYLVSSVSVLLLGITSWKSANSNPALMFCLIGGVIASILGMVLRWISYQLDDG